VLAPILPARLEALHCPPLLAGAIFGAFPITVAAASLAAPLLSHRVGRLPVLYCGIATEGALVIVFGFAHSLLHSERSLLWAYFLLRVAQGLGEAAQSTMLLAYATDAFAPRGCLGAAMGWQETAAGLGIVLGPALGGVMSDVAGFASPFVLLGVAILLLLFLMPAALQQSGKPGAVEPPRAPAPPWRAFLSYDFVNAGAATVLVGTAFGAIVPTLAPHLASTLALHTATRVSCAYIIPALVYGICCPLIGEAADKIGYRRIMRLGFCALACSFCMIGPLPPLRDLFALRAPGSARAWVWAVAAMGLFGVGGAAGFVPTLPAMQRGAEAMGPAGTETVAGLYWTLYYLGEGIGPFIGTAAVRALGPGWGYGCVAALLAAYTGIAAHYAQSAAPEAAAAEGEGARETEMVERGERENADECK
jgi:MFS family permease